MTKERKIEELLYSESAGALVTCKKAELNSLDQEPTLIPDFVFDLMIPKKPTVSIVGLLKKNRKKLDQIIGTGNYLIKIRNFHYYFSYIHFMDYPYKKGMESFLSISATEAMLEDGKLGVDLKITVIGKPVDIVNEEIELYLLEKIHEFNLAAFKVAVSSCSLGFKADPFSLIGEQEPEYEELDLAELLHNIEYE